MTKRTYKGWTPADDAELVLLREAITPTKEIARVLKRTPSSVANRISILKLPVGGKRKEPRQVEMDFPAQARVARKAAQKQRERDYPKIVTVQGSQPKPTLLERMFNKLLWRK
jgi:hypothetical protein